MRRKLYKTFLLSALAIVLLLSVTACAGKTPQMIDTYASAKSDLYASAAELEAAAQLVVRVEKTEQEENVAVPLSAQGAYHGYTLSEVSVKEVLTDSAGRNVQPGDRLQILENQFTYAEQDGTQATCHINRYVKMQPGKEYYLFLRYSEENGYYVILSGLLGKVPVDESEPVLFPAAELTQLSPDAGAVEENSETKQLLERIREESIARYGAQ